MKRVPYEVMVNEFERVLTKYGFEPKDAKASAELFAQNSMAGVYSHGLNRFPRVVEYLKKGESSGCYFPVQQYPCQIPLPALLHGP